MRAAHPGGAGRLEFRPAAGGPHDRGTRMKPTRTMQQSGLAEMNVYGWDMRDPMAPVLKEKLQLPSGQVSHWLTFGIKGDYGYIAPVKNSDGRTEIFAVRTHRPVGTIAGSEDMLEIDFVNGKVRQVGDQYGIERRR